MKVVVMGSGAVGTFLGAALMRGGLDATLVARGKHFHAMQTNGVRISGSLGDYQIAPVKVTERVPSTSIDLIFLCVKSYDTEAAVRDLVPCLAEHTLIVTLQNGINRSDAVKSTGLVTNVLPGLAYVSAKLVEPGHVRCIGTMSSIAIEKFPEMASGNQAALVAGLENAGVRVDVFASMDRELWRKFLLLSTNAILTCLSRLPAGVVYHDPRLCDLAKASLREVASVAALAGVRFSEEDLSEAFKQGAGFPPEMYASMFHDLVNGRKMELDALTGELVRRAEHGNIPVPIHKAAYACLKPFSDQPKEHPHGR